MALLPLGYPRAVISLGIIRGDNSFVHKGTGFLCRHPLCNTADGTRYLTFLITNRHVVEKGVTHVRFDRITEDAVGILEILMWQNRCANLGAGFKSHRTRYAVV